MARGKLNVKQLNNKHDEKHLQWKFMVAIMPL